MLVIRIDYTRVGQMEDARVCREWDDSCGERNGHDELHRLPEHATTADPQAVLPPDAGRLDRSNHLDTSFHSLGPLTVGRVARMV